MWDSLLLDTPVLVVLELTLPRQGCLPYQPYIRDPMQKERNAGESSVGAGRSTNREQVFNQCFQACQTFQGGLVLLRLFKWLNSSGLGGSFSIITNFAPILATVPLPGHWLSWVPASEELFALHRKMPALLYSLG